MKSVYTLIIFLFVANFKTYAQCGVGQTPTTAELVCGSKITSHGTVPKCPGKNIPVPGCPDPFGTYQDINAYYYTFTCYTAGALEFLIKPITNSEDYDWQLFDITNRNFSDIYDQNLASSIFVACNWSGEPGNTGTASSATQANGCQGSGVPPITKAPTMLQGHTYLLMVSHFTPTAPGFDIQFIGTTSSLISNPTNIPKLDSVTTICGGNTISFKLNKRISCNSIDKSDFSISTNPTIANITRVGCISTNSYTDSIVVTLANPLPSGTYTATIVKGTDLNTLVDECDNAVIAGADVKTIEVYQKPNPNFTTTIIKETCKADTILYSHNGNNRTSNWEWSFDGTPTTSTSQTQQVVYNSFTTRVVKLKVSNAICSDSTTQSIPIADHLLVPKFGASRDTTCPNNPESFTDSTKGNTISWKWDFANGQTSTLKNPPTQTYPILPINKFYDTKLVVASAFGCVDSVVKSIFVRGTIPTEFDSIIPPTCAANEVKIYFKQAMICGSVAPDGTDFLITGPTANSITGASISCVNGVGTVVTLQLSNALKTGTYQLSLKVGSDVNTIINDCGIATLPKTLSFNALGHIDTAFNFTTKLGCLADTVNYNHPSNNGSNNWQWIFDGNPATSNIQNPTVIYTDFTKRDVQLIVSNGVCFDTISKSITITDHSIKAKFGSIDTTCGNAGTMFTDSSKGIITNWYWNFGNGQTSNAKNPAPVNYTLSFVYASYPVQLIVKNSVGCYDTSTIKSIVVKPSSPATMDKISDLPCSPDSFIIHFNAPMLCNSLVNDGSDFSITGPSSPIVSSAYIINCNNGTGRDVVVKLVAPITFGGYYKLNLKKGNDGNTILNDCGIETPATFIGFVAFNKVNASFTYVDKINCTEDTLFLNHTVANDEKKWTWIINGTAVGNVNDYVLPYKESGVKNIILITENPVCKDTSNQKINLIFDKVKAKFLMSDNVVCTTDNISFTDTSNGNIVGWNWNFGNGQTSNIKTPLPQTYTAKNYPVNTGSNFEDFKVQLIVQNAVPCYDTSYQKIRVTTNCLVQVPSAFTPNNDGLNDFLYPLNAYKAVDINFRVFNRLGRMVYESHNTTSKWEGKFRGEKQPSGTYIWTLDYTDRDSGKKISLNGTTVLIR